MDKPRAGLVISILLRPCVIIWPERRWKTIPFNPYRSRIIFFFFFWFTSRFHGNFHASRWNFVRVSYYFRPFRSLYIRRRREEEIYYIERSNLRKEIPDKGKIMGNRINKIPLYNCETRKGRRLITGRRKLRVKFRV